MQGFLSGKLVLNATIMAGNTQWKQYSPQDFLILDKLVIPPGMDMDNLLLRVDMHSEEYLFELQNARKHPDHFLIEKTFTLKKAGEKAASFDHKSSGKKDAGYTIAATPHNPQADPALDAAKKLLEAVGLGQKDVQTLDVENLGNKELKDIFGKLAAKAEAKYDVVKVAVSHPKHWRTTLSKLEKGTQRKAEL